MNKTLFTYCQKHLRFSGNIQLKENASLKRLVSEYNIGRIENRIFNFNDKDKLHLAEVVAQELNGILLSDTYPEKQSRINNAKNNRNEKVNALKVSEDYILVNSLTSLCLNQQVTDNGALSSLGNFICSSEIKTVEHQQIILVENLEIMANLALLNIPDELQGALWLYRGNKEKHKQTSTASQFFKRFKQTNQLVCFSDFDPAGLKIALTCGATQWLTLAQKDDIKIDIPGYEQEWFKQQKEKSFLSKNLQLSDSINALFSSMNINQTTLKQEHIVAHSLELALFPLPIL